MKRIGIIGLGDMGMGLAQNILKAGYELTGFDLREERLRLLKEAGGRGVNTVSEVGKNADTVFIMVLNGSQVLDVVDGDNGLRAVLKPGNTIIVSATIEVEVQYLRLAGAVEPADQCRADETGTSGEQDPQPPASHSSKPGSARSRSETIIPFSGTGH